MFALAGYVGSDPINSECINQMLNKISPYENGNSYVHGGANFALGIKQLSPRFDESRVQYSQIEGASIAFSGRIFNRSEIAPNAIQDAEAVLTGYKKWGKAVFEKLQGPFALGIYDSESGEMIIARDGCGMRPMYYYHSGSIFAFASDTRGFEGFDGFEKQLNESVIGVFLCFGSVASKETLIKGVFRLEPGCMLCFKDGKAEKEEFFRLEFTQENKSVEEFTEEIHEAAVSVINRNAIGNYGSFLSSGVDSSYIASVAKPPKTFTAGYSDSKYDESRYTKELAELLGIENSARIITPEEYLSGYKTVVKAMDMPLSNPSVSSIFYGAGAASRQVDAIISGEGADELFGGYNSYKEEISHRKYMQLPYFIRHLAYILTCWIPSRKFDFFARRGQKLKDYHIGLDRVFKDKEAEKIINFGNQMHTKAVVAEYYEKYSNCSTLRQRQAIDFHFWLINDFVQCVARSAEHFGIEPRFPLLSKELIGIAVKLPDEYKLMNGMTKYAFRMAAKKAIPNDAHSRKKLGFPVPLKKWIRRKDYYNEIKAEFQSDVARRFFNSKKILKLLEEHKNGKKDNYKRIWAVYTFILWYKLNFND